ncbi:hypothetical protein [Streptococcus sp. sy004]|uniref:hypothetical protein n=1 Tax=Streptococcus sp. sy004 TaxID=2600149 RepID=UPI0011B44C2E|nr:hypothetical protein [Streptococcus sp. sy004]TWT12156.1 hypothetical protein FRX54_01100 [Streptococcus sp. sy004]
MIGSDLTSYIFGKVADSLLIVLIKKIGLQENQNEDNLIKSIEDFKNYLKSRHKENPNFEMIENFWKKYKVVEEIIKIRYDLNSQYQTYKQYKKYLEDEIIRNDNIDSDFCLELLDELNNDIKLSVRNISNLPQADLSVYKSLQEAMMDEISETSKNINTLLQELNQLAIFLKQEGFKEEEVIPAITKYQMKNLKIISPSSSSLTFTINNSYRNNYHLFPSIEFEGDFGYDPTLYLIYSKDDTPLRFSSSESLIQSDNIQILKLNKELNVDSKYIYRISEQISYFSNKKSEYDIRPFIIVVLGEEAMGIATLIVINKSFKIPDSNIIRIPYMGTNYFIPQVRKFNWPKKKDLLRSVREPQTGKVFLLEKEIVDDILAIISYFKEDLKKEIKDAL